MICIGNKLGGLSRKKIIHIKDNSKKDYRRRTIHYTEIKLYEKRLYRKKNYIKNVKDGEELHGNVLYRKKTILHRKKTR